MMHKRTILDKCACIAALAAMLLAGCGRESGDVATGESETAVSAGTVSPERELELRTKLYRLSNPRATVDEVEALRRVLVSSMAQHFAEQIVLLRLAAENGIEAEAEEIAAHAKPLEEAIARLEASEREEVLSLARAEALCEKVKDALVGEFADTVTDEKIDETMAQGRELAAMSAATNTLVRARAESVWKRLLDGEDFAALAKEFNEADEAPDFDWGTYALEEFDDSPELQDALRGMKEGEFSQPVEGDNGLVIVRVTSIEGEESSPKYSLDRIFFHLAEDVPQWTRDEIRTAIAENLAKEFIHRETMKITNTKTIEKETQE